MKNTFPVYYKNFKCIADKCPDTCCAGWAIVVDCESKEKYMHVGGRIGEKLRSHMSVDSDGDTVFVSETSRCPFLLESNLCEIYSEIGETALCNTCKQFPRHVTDLGSRKETGISLSCPEAARLIFASSEPIEFETVDEDVPIQPNNIDPSLYITLFRAQNTAINILQNRNYSVPERLAAFLRCCERIQKSIRTGDCHNPCTERESFILPSPSEVQANRTVKGWFDLLDSLEKLDPDWRFSLDSAKNNTLTDNKDYLKILSENEWEAEHLAVYFLFRYFMTAVFDGNLISKAKFVIFSVIMCLLLGSAQTDPSDRDCRIEAMRTFSKEIEHSAENMDAVFLKIKKSRHFDSDNIINILSSNFIPHKEK
ncbi:MAG: flagellin lysine-N-methylase [Clostridia bacterium]|nr:flagellin lysine-N-methylase [Clostridia bacterium]